MCMHDLMHLFIRGNEHDININHYYHHNVFVHVAMYMYLLLPSKPLIIPYICMHRMHVE